ncbi:phosphonomutase [Sphingomonas oleivorans]|uniref:Phosphonomutase n=1 Tax=Sphingomonas oleivorans TaxID=1735121 RepID=A0A2T5FVF7_9SPHN|nr:isocitrate lyase/phosphoenolpyruvate mutase family protein [Sphingomonas oleivorans]PTQ09426.1 phosphonomutase [Sphingomonas oleivorans]
MSQINKAKHFASLHRSEDPLFLYNIWDAGGAKVIAEAGAPAIATGSMSMAIAHGYQDGQQIPLDLVLTIVSRICNTVDLPITVDFEGGYADNLSGLAENTSRLIASGAVGINFEDQLVNGDGLYTISEQCDRISTIREAAESANMPLFINARTDLFLRENDNNKYSGLVDEAITRAKAYALAGASGFFVPGLTDVSLIQVICENVDLPVNVMRIGTAPEKAELSSSGVARISCGPGPYFDFADGLKAAFIASKDR